MAVGFVKKFEPMQKIDFKERFPGVPEDALNMLEAMLKFNPFLRPSILECLDNPFFDEVRDKKVQKRPKVVSQLDDDPENCQTIEGLRGQF